jgi:class 3 adenylate cyclase
MICLTHADPDPNPPSEAGLDAAVVGATVIFQEGEVNGWTVNLASRLASVAQAGEVVVRAEVASDPRA